MAIGRTGTVATGNDELAMFFLELWIHNIIIYTYICHCDCLTHCSKMYLIYVAKQMFGFEG